VRDGGLTFLAEVKILAHGALVAAADNGRNAAAVALNTFMSSRTSGRITLRTGISTSSWNLSTTGEERSNEIEWIAGTRSHEASQHRSKLQQGDNSFLAFSSCKELLNLIGHPARSFRVADTILWYHCDKVREQ